MKFKAIYKNESDIPADQREFYTERDGTFYLNVEEVEGYKLDNPQALKNSVTAIRKERDDAQSALKSFEGIEDPQKAIDAMKRLEELGDLDGLDINEKIKAQVEEHKTQLSTKFENDRLKLEAKAQKDAADSQAKYDSLFDQYRKEAIRGEAHRVLQELGGNSKLLMPVIEGRARVNPQEDGSYKIQIMGDDGNPVMSGEAGNTSDMTLKEFVTGLRNDNDLAAAFSGDGASGSGSGPTPPGGKPTGKASGPAIRITSAEAGDLENWKRVTAQAESEGRAVEIVD